jgi:membrane protease YdiL (CAAX protease family)
MATLPLLLGLAWLRNVRQGPLRALLDLVVEQIGPYLAHMSVMELALLALIAGFSEEVLFRGVLQVGLTDWLSPTGALLASSVVFGLVHWASRAYAVFAGVMGVYLGLLFLVQQNLLSPIVTHASYDFVALLLVARLHRERLQPKPT